MQISSSFSHSAAFLWKTASLFSSIASICFQMASSFSVAILVTGSIGADVAAKAEVAVPMAVTTNASANTRLQIVFFFMVCYAPFFNRFGWASTLIVVYRRAPNTSPAKVHGKCHKSATRPVRKMNESPLHASRAETGGRSYSDFTSRIKMDLIHIFPGPFAKASHFAP